MVKKNNKTKNIANILLNVSIVIMLLGIAYGWMLTEPQIGETIDYNKKLKTLLITSTFPSEGKSWVASNLAVTFAQAGNKVILIDADMRKGRQYTIFGVSPRPGLSNYLSGIDVENPDEIDISKYIQKTE